MSFRPAREHPPDLRSPRLIPRLQCPAGRGCGCCPGPVGHGHVIPGENGRPGRQITNCSMPHPPIDRECRPPYPNTVPPCPERAWQQPTAPGQSTSLGRCCIECGRVTTRVYLGNALPWAKNTTLPWCAGTYPSN